MVLLLSSVTKRSCSESTGYTTFDSTIIAIQAKQFETRALTELILECTDEKKKNWLIGRLKELCPTSDVDSILSELLLRKT